MSHATDSHFEEWINPDEFPHDKLDFTGGFHPGQDAVIGQWDKKSTDKNLKTSIFDGHGKHNQVTFQSFIESHGGDYFFSPSLKLLRDLSRTRAFF